MAKKKGGEENPELVAARDRAERALFGLKLLIIGHEPFLAAMTAAKRTCVLDAARELMLAMDNVSAAGGWRKA